MAGHDLNTEHTNLMQAGLDRVSVITGDLIETHLRKTTSILLKSERLLAKFGTAA